MPVLVDRWNRVRAQLWTFLSLGVRPGQDLATRERVLIINLCASLFLIITLMALPSIGRGSVFNDAASIVSVLFQGLVLAFNTTGNFRTARFLFLALNHALLFAATAGNPREMNLYLLYSSLIVFPEILFGRNERPLARFFQILAIASYFVFVTFPPPWFATSPPPAEVLVRISRLMIFATGIYLITAIRFLGRIREIYESEDANHRARMLTNAKMAALGEMAGGMAHEINNPLAIIRGKAEQLAHQAATGGPVREIEQGAKVIQKHADRIASIVRGLRSFARDGETDPFSNSSVSKILVETVALCRARFAHHGIELRVSGLESDVEFQCRPVQVEQVLINLLNNSFDALGTASERWVEVSFRECSDGIEFSVTDSGSGISPEIADKILQPFFTTKSVGRGTGLGLSISSGIARAHHGELFLDRTSPWTRFVLLLPKSQPVQA